ncbi:MAG: zinc dependent phospholipase C family protein [Desulfovibrionaceae bacterium]
MPKETTHLCFADRLVRTRSEDASPDPRLAAVLRAFPQGLLWGAVSPDVFYYGFSKRLEAASGNLHGVGEKAARPRALTVLNAACASRSGELFAFCLGLVSHIVLDVWLHPAVRAFSGEPESPETLYRHRLIETWLARRDASQWAGVRALDLRAGEKLAGFRLLAPGLSERDIRLALSRFSRVQRLLGSRILYDALRPLSLPAPSLVLPVLALMDRRLATHPIRISHELEQDIDRRLDCAFQSAQKAFTACGRVFYEQGEPAQACNAIPDASLELGAAAPEASCHCGR